VTPEFFLPDPVGRDPFDALRGTRVPGFVRSSPRLRQYAIQLRKRVPVEVGGLLGVQPFAMAKTVGSLLWAEARVQSLGHPPLPARAQRLYEQLERCEGRAGDGGWGYEFDVQTRWGYYPAGSPNLIATAFVGRGLMAAGLVFGQSDWLDEGIRSAQFVAEKLLRTDSAGRPAFFYTLDTERLIHNANLLGCALVASAARLSQDTGLLEAAVRAAEVSLDAQTHDGSWPYGDTPALSWVDSFHTAYVLDGLLQLWLATDSEVTGAALQCGAAFWESRFFGSQGEPSYYAGGSYPYDIHSAATACDVGFRLATWGLLSPKTPERVAEWTARNLVDPATGGTYYRKNGWFTDKRSFARWGDAHWALARASQLVHGSGGQDPAEQALRPTGGPAA